jgi:hypothetical protein
MPVVLCIATVLGMAAGVVVKRESSRLSGLNRPRLQFAAHLAWISHRALKKRVEPRMTRITRMGRKTVC